MDTVRIGIVGSGFMAHTYAETIAKYTHHGTLIALAGGRRAPALAETYGIACEPTVEALMARDDIDAVMLTAPEQVRMEQTLLAAAHGKHVLSEKPMATSVVECNAMIDACNAAGVTLMIIQSQRFRGVHVTAKRLIDEGRIGQVNQFSIWSHSAIEWSIPVVNDRPWYRDPKAGLIMSQGVHVFDMMRWLVGSEASRIFAHQKSYGDHDIPNLSTMALVEFVNGASAQVWMDMEMPGMTFPKSQFHSQVVGSKGLLDLDGYTHVDLGLNGEWERVYEQPSFDPFNPLDPVRLGSFTAQNQAFIDCILNGTPPLVSGADGRAAVELCEATMLSAQSGQAVDLPLNGR